MNTQSQKNKHMTLDDRLEIQNGLNLGMTFKSIANRIGKDQTTVSKEVKLRAKRHTNGNTTLPDEVCPLLMKAPYVCNGCKNKSTAKCHYSQRRYIAKQAQQDYESLLSEAREGIPLNKESFYDTEKKISKAVLSGQHIYHAIKANKLPVSTATVYRHIKRGYYSISPLDLPRALKFRPRKTKCIEYVPTGIKEGRTFEDFTEYIAENNITQYVEMDTVIGKVGGKVIMTLHFTAFDFMIGLLMENKTAAECGNRIKELKESLTRHNFTFGDIFPVILTDNGGEFSNVFAFENSTKGTKETHIFYCDPNKPYQKPHVENNHTMFRSIVPSGESFDEFTQETVNLIFSHINATKRKQFNGKSPYDLFTFSYSVELANVLGITFVAPQDVIQNKRLLR